MSRRQLALFCISLLALSPVLVFAHKIHIPASTKECFFEDLHENDQVRIISLCLAFTNWPSQMTVTYQVGEGGHLDIDFWVRFACIPSLPYSFIHLQLADPEGSMLTKHIRYSTGSTSITAEKDGRYEYCFSNQMSTMADKEVRCAHCSRGWAARLDALLMHSIALMFTVSYTSRKMVSLFFIPLPLLTIVIVVEDIVAPVEREIRSLAIGLLAVKDEQEYIVVRERRHRDTAESTNDRVKWWSVLQAAVLFSVVAWQIYYLKASPTNTSVVALLTELPVILRGKTYNLTLYTFLPSF